MQFTLIILHIVWIGVSIANMPGLLEASLWFACMPVVAAGCGVIGAIASEGA